jgi:hypothetical protein
MLIGIIYPTGVHPKGGCQAAVPPNPQDFLTVDDGTDMLSRNVGKGLTCNSA